MTAMYDEKYYISTVYDAFRVSQDTTTAECPECGTAVNCEGALFPEYFVIDQHMAESHPWKVAMFWHDFLAQVAADALAKEEQQ